MLRTRLIYTISVRVSLFGYALEKPTENDVHSSATLRVVFLCERLHDSDQDQTPADTAEENWHQNEVANAIWMNGKASIKIYVEFKQAKFLWL